MIMEDARCMILHAGFPLQFWTNVVDNVVYLINRGPSSALDGGIPKEASAAKKVNYSFFRTFGFEAFVHIDKENKANLEAPRNAPLLDTRLMILVIAYGIMKITKSLGVDMQYSMKRLCTKIGCKE